MKDTFCCSFCGKPEGAISTLVVARKGRSCASICDECLEVCRKILAKSGTEPIIDPAETGLLNSDAPATDAARAGLSKSDSPKTCYRIGPQPHEPRLLSCSFCGTSQEKAHRLIGTPKHLQPAYICDKCVAGGEAASSGGYTSSFGNWIARKMGRHETTIRNI